MRSSAVYYYYYYCAIIRCAIYDSFSVYSCHSRAHLVCEKQRHMVHNGSSNAFGWVVSRAFFIVASLHASHVRHTRFRSRRTFENILPPMYWVHEWIEYANHRFFCHRCVYRHHDHRCLKWIQIMLFSELIAKPATEKWTFCSQSPRLTCKSLCVSSVSDTRHTTNSNH